MNPIFIRSENIKRKLKRIKRKQNVKKKREAPKDTRKLKKTALNNLNINVRESRSTKRSSSKRDSRGDEVIRTVLLQNVCLHPNKSRPDTSPDPEMQSQVQDSTLIVNQVDNLDTNCIESLQKLVIIDFHYI